MDNDKSFAVILPAAGSGTRFGGGDKLLQPLSGRTVLQRAVALFTSRPDVVLVVIATAPERHENYRQHLAEVLRDKPLLLVAGGAERWNSVQRALAATPRDIACVAIHDAARPLTPPEVIDAAFSEALRSGAAVPAVPEPATLKRVGADGSVRGTVERANLCQAQTPQCFSRQLLEAAFASLLERTSRPPVTDDSQVMELAGQPVTITAGSAGNIKITTAEDLRLAAALLRAAGEAVKA